MKIINEKCNQKHEILIFLIFLSLIMKFSEGSEVFVSVAQAQSHSKDNTFFRDNSIFFIISFFILLIFS